MKIKKQNNKWFFTADIGNGMYMQYQFARLQSAINEAISLYNSGEIKDRELNVEASAEDILDELGTLYQEGYNKGSNDAQEVVACQLDVIINKAGLNKNG